MSTIYTTNMRINVARHFLAAMGFPVYLISWELDQRHAILWHVHSQVCLDNEGRQKTSDYEIATQTWLTHQV